MRIKLIDGVFIRGEPHRPGQIVDLEPDDFLNVLASGRGVALDRDDHARALDASNHAAVRVLSQRTAWARY